MKDIYNEQDIINLVEIFMKWQLTKLPHWLVDNKEYIRHKRNKKLNRIF
jgi:hypothetical protein